MTSSQPSIYFFLPKMIWDFPAVLQANQQWLGQELHCFLHRISPVQYSTLHSKYTSVVLFDHSVREKSLIRCNGVCTCANGPQVHSTSLYCCITGCRFVTCFTSSPSQYTWDTSLRLSVHVGPKNWNTCRLWSIHKIRSYFAMKSFTNINIRKLN